MKYKSATFPVLATFAVLATFLKAVSAASPGNCIADETINAQFADIISGGTSDTYEIPDGSCCQEQICLLGCPEEVEDPAKGKLFIFAFQRSLVLNSSKANPLALSILQVSELL